MAQNYMMGAGMTPPPAPGSPQAMNFQSDPMQRSQFKGFMSGIQAKQPAQMMPPAQPMAPAIPPQMANVDIFAAPQGFRQGGVIPALKSMARMGQTMSQQLQSVVNGGPGLSGAVGALGGSGMSFNPGMGNGMSGPPVSAPAVGSMQLGGGENAFPGMFDVTTQGGGAFASDYPRGGGFSGNLSRDELFSRGYDVMPRPGAPNVDPAGVKQYSSMFDSPAFSGGTPTPTPMPFSSLGGAVGNVPGFANGGALDAFGGAGPDVESLRSGDTTIGPSSIGDSGDSSSFTYADNRSMLDRASDTVNDFLSNIDFGGQDGPFNSLPSYSGQPTATAPTAAGGITDALADQIAQNAARQEATAQIAAADRAAMQPQIDAIAGSYTPGEDRQIMDLLSAQNLAQEIASQGGIVDVNPVTGQVIAANYPTAGQPMTAQRSSIPGTSDQGFRTVDTRITPDVDYADPTMVPIGGNSTTSVLDMANDKYTQDALLSNMPTPISMPDEIRAMRGNGFGEEQVGATPEQGRVDIRGTGSYDEAGLNIPGAPSTSDLGALGEGSFPTVSTESIMDRASRKDDMSDARNLVTRGFGAGMDPMEQLKARNERDIFDVSGPPGIGQAIQGGLNSIARGLTGNVLEKLEQPGSTPVYDETGQIVGVTHGGLFGGTVYTGRPDYNPTGRGANLGTEGREEIRFNNRGGFSVGAGTGSSREAGGLDKFGAAASDAGDSFLKMLGFGG